MELEHCKRLWTLGHFQMEPQEYRKRLFRLCKTFRNYLSTLLSG